MLMGASPFLVVFMCGVVFGYAVKSIPFINNKVIPLLVIILCSILFRYSQKVTDADCQNWYNPEMRLYMIGGLIGFASWIAHNKYLKKWIDDRWFNGKNGGDQSDQLGQKP